MKTCQRCGVLQPVENFQARVERGGRRRGTCNGCRVSAHSESRRRHPEWKRGTAKPTPEKSADYSRYFNHGITAERYAEMLAAQGGVCAICRKACSTGRRLAVDHDHSCCPGSRSCGQCIRGLLCMKCNAGLGHLDDNYDLVMTAAAYLLAARGDLG